ncbi:transcription antitermination protein NusB [Alphaproteobacteria bacterium]|nr:transcription antitermination protein NusB [Alphaproteobacteria bacterium]
MAKEQQDLKPVPVRRRSASRLAAIQITYQAIMSEKPVLECVPDFLAHYAADVIKSFRVKDLDHEHFNALYAGMESHGDELDGEIASCLSADWSIDRLTMLDRVVLRAGTFELRQMPHIPARAAVSEYASLSDACGCDVAFINAVLDRVARAQRRVEMGTA